MKTFFVRMCAAFIIAQFISMIILFTTLAIGFRYSLSDWEKSYQGAVKKRVLEVLQKVYLENELIWERTIRDSFKNFYLDGIEIYFYVSANGPLYLIRGKGSEIEVFLPTSAEVLRRLPVYQVAIHKKTFGFFAINFDRFQSLSSNQKFIDSLTRGSIISFATSFLMAMVLAFVISRNFSAKAVQTAEAIQNIAGGDLHVVLPETGPQEFSQISRAVNILSEKLANEKQLRDQWIQDIAHDLRTPVSAMKAQLEALADGVLPFTHERLKRNLKQLSRIEHLISDLSEIMKLESPEILLQKSSVSLSPCIREILLRFSAYILKKEITVNNTCEEVELYADETLLVRALVNIIDNAVKYCNDNGTLKISCSMNKKQVILVVTNTGSYIAEQELKKVFDRLYRSEEARSTEGTGLGLTIAKKIIDLHGGGILIRSEKQTGTSVEITLPTS